MRTTVTLDDDVSAKLSAETARTGRPFKEVINEAIRRGLLARPRSKCESFSIESHPLGLLPGLSYENTEELLERAEGIRHR